MQEQEWEREYRESKFLTKDNKPQSDVVRFVKFLKKEFKNISVDTECQQDFENINVLDLGCGTGRNSFYFAELGSKVLGLEISQTAINIAQKNNEEESNSLNDQSMSKCLFDIEYIKQSMGEKFPCEDDSFDVVLDVTSSNSLTEAEREVYLSETQRVLKQSGYFFVKALCKDGDDNAKFLLKNNPGKEVDTYILPEIGVTERVWTREDFTKTYEKYFNILNLEKKTTYTKMNNRSYKRNFWICYLKKI